ncbi:hypothetical protein EJ05DRAFT_472122 [Pseudovirgaria hyperparasitica]|uniref:Heterokaryon incompatibility domain-containing protein n=1 Tax=Pseudovirgaria hyperparasitica TaxID=470096 RepID=A0A6A6WM29_9PEZI|nr:uncharacterized protein EJ05DRAFT_472122 [Pseudovirgaria hyperparasitica]KAF2763213.1 hypothetical protein EJ05DRAFT_472122 [Pseudovirgaria hyperparasitica]
MEGSRSAYTYSLCPLPDRLNFSRILKIQPSHGHDDAPLVCELSVMPNDSSTSVRFEALSWTWGQTGDRTNIIIKHGADSYAKEVSTNLASGLKRLRDDTRPRNLWCDQICIDQENTEERNAQVASMTNIYGKADNVCIWLGEGDAETDRAIEFIEKEVMKLGDFGAVMQQTTAADNLVALQTLMNLPWFSRRWVVQEITLAKRATLYCGTKLIPWNDFADAVTLCADIEAVSGELSVIIRKDATFGNVPRFYENVHELSAYRLVEAANSIVRRSSNSFSGPPAEIDSEIERFFSLEYLVSTLSSFESSNPRDTIYALLSIAKDSIPETKAQVGADDMKVMSSKQQGVFEKWSKAFRKWGSEKIQQSAYVVSYGQGEIEVWKEFIQFVVRNAEPSRCLDILCRSWAPESKPESQQKTSTPVSNPESQQKTSTPVVLPSWICTVANRTFAVSGANPKLGQRVERRNANALVGLPEFDQGNYKASGLRTIRPLLKFENCEAQKNGPEILRTYYDRTKSTKVTPENEFESLHLSGFKLDTIEKLGERSQSGNIPGEWFEIGGWFKGAEVPDEFWRTIVANRRADGRPASRIYPRLCGFSLMTGPGGNDVNISELMTNNTFTSAHFNGFLKRVQSVIWNRRMVRSTNGYLGLLPRNTKEDDIICILGGCSVPVVLRRHTKTKEQGAFQTECRRTENITRASILIADAWRRKAYGSDMLKVAETIKWPSTRLDTKAASASITSSASLPSTPTRVRPVDTQESGGKRKRERTPGSTNGKLLRSKKKQKTGPGLEKSPLLEHKQSTKTASSPTSPSKQVPKKSSIFWNPEADEEYYEFIGECYIHGMMNGEALKLQSKRFEAGDTSMENVTFELR